jgi:hypothetical protein
VNLFLNSPHHMADNDREFFEREPRRRFRARPFVAGEMLPGVTLSFGSTRGFLAFETILAYKLEERGGSIFQPQIAGACCAQKRAPVRGPALKSSKRITKAANLGSINDSDNQERH